MRCSRIKFRIGFAAYALFAYPGQLLAACVLEKYAELPVMMEGPRPIIAGTIDGIPARFLADSGAFYSMLWSDRVARFKLNVTEPPGGYQVIGVTGAEVAHVATVKDFSLAGFGRGSLHKVQFLVAGRTQRSEDGLIGQNIIGRADSEYDLGNGVIRLHHATDCENSSLAYWSGTAPVSTIRIGPTTDSWPHIIGSAKLNGVEISVVFDTGATHSELSLKAALQAGFDPSKAEKHYTDVSGPIGSKEIEIWLARFDDLDLGGEQIKNAQLWVTTSTFSGTADLLLGADFFLSHRIYVAASQHKIYFTYNGGPVFDLHDRGDAKTATPAAAADDKALLGLAEAPEAPKDALSYRRRAAASAARGDLTSAIADYDAAIKADAADPESYYLRALAKWRVRQLAEAKDDLDQALTMTPDNIQYRMARGRLCLSTNDETGAGADFDAVAGLQPDDAAVGLEIADIYTDYDHFEGAISRLGRWVDKYPKSGKLPVALNNRCRARAMMGKELELALADCNASLKIDPRSPVTLDSRGLVWLRLGNYDEAVADYKAGIKLKPKEAWSLYGLGLAEIKKNRKEDGNASIQAALARDPEIANKFQKLGLTP